MENRILCLGDVHGSYKGMMQCFERAKFDYENDILISLGDTCVLPDTNIITKKGNRKIKDIKIGDEILTHKNRFKKVKKIFKRKIEEEILFIKTWKSQKLKITKNHPVFDGKQFKRADEFKNEDYVYIPKKEFINQKHIDLRQYCNSFAVEKNGILYSKLDQIKSSSIPIFLKLTTLNLKVIGYFIGDGTARYVKKRGTVSFSLQKTGRKIIVKKDIIKFCKNLNIKYFLIEKDNLITIHINSKILASFFRSFYNERKEKIIPEFIFNIGNEQFLNVLYGLIFTDGCFDKIRVRFNNTSLRLIEDIITKSYLLGLAPTVCVSRKEGYFYFQNRGKKYLQKIYYEISWRSKYNKKLFNVLGIKKKSKGKEDFCKHVNNYTKVKIKNIEKMIYEGEVYNIQIEDDNTYIASDIIVHNCDGWSQTFECLEELLKIKKLIYIRGNHCSWMLVWAVTGIQKMEWVSQGGKATIKSYQHYYKNVPESHIDLIKNAKYYYIHKDYEINSDKTKDEILFVHGGIIPELDIEKQDKYNIMWDRELICDARTMSFINPKHRMQKRFKEIFVGHTSTSMFGTDMPVNYCEVWDLDTGGGWEGKITIMDIKTKQFWQSDYCYDLYPEEKGKR